MLTESLYDIKRLAGLICEKDWSAAQKLKVDVGNKLGKAQTVLVNNGFTTHQVDQAMEFISKRPKMAATFQTMNHPNQIATLKKVLNHLSKGSNVTTGATATNKAGTGMGTTATMGNPNMGGVA